MVPAVLSLMGRLKKITTNVANFDNLYGKFVIRTCGVEQINIFLVFIVSIK